MKNGIILLVVFLCVISCKKGSKQEQLLSMKGEETTEIKNIKENFTEGKIDIQIYFRGNRLSEVLNRVDPSQGDIQQQLKKYTKELSAEEAENIQKVMSANPVLAMQIMFLPMLNNEIFVRGNRATAKCDGLMYHLENTLNGSNETGTVFIQSQSDKDNQVTFNYDKDFFGESQLQARIDLEMYDRKPTGETEEIAGYQCSKAVYTLKNASPMGIGKLEVWTSEQMPESLNFIHPYYLEEEHGIMKIAVYHDSQSDMPMVYEFKKVSPGPVNDSDMEIMQSQPVYEGKSDMETIGARLMGIMFGN
ncbi:hypothetical protein [Sinomicrobium weinanense]|uniref:Uncharacterized protein n=1 Tax=Sinomicrobium weinanense TaxID=2842200 RepID=A0A926JPS3_9FLAO|nr:hypothetical protein [Sinomicrobium weinanense]MBC9795208.1 hypothetical protein [Sinomicrobium weinanense]MBU3121985.1 hypothetical protein [Sinomicrobium weinanense]